MQGSASALLLDLEFKLALLVQKLVGFPGKLRDLDPVPGRLELAVDVGHLDLAGMLRLAARQGDQAGDQEEDGQHEGGDFGQKQGVLRDKAVHWKWSDARLGGCVS